VATVTPFTLESPSQFRADPPPSLSNKRYRKDYNEIKAIGASDSSICTAEQTDIGYFWAANMGVLWNRAIQGIVLASPSILAESAASSLSLTWREPIPPSLAGISSTSTSSGTP
jgi:hypothetical protein